MSSDRRPSRRGSRYCEYPEGILDDLLEGCQVLGFDWRFKYLNRAVEAQSRRPNSEMIGKAFTETWPGIEKTALYDAIKDCMENRAPRHVDNLFTYPDGTGAWFELLITPVPEGVFIMSLDITARKIAEQELDELDERFRQAQKLEAIGQLAGGVAHDFNNIVSVILGHVEMAIEKAGQDESLQSDLAAIHAAALRSTDLTRQLLAFARRQVYTPQVLDLNQVIDKTLHMLRRLIGEDIALDWYPGGSLFNIKLDPSQVEQVLTNLCVNARDAIAGTGSIKIETKNAVIGPEYCRQNPEFVVGDFVQLSISDTGKGMDRETLARIFEPFFTTKGLGEGTGLGLSTVYGIVKQNSGFINVYSEPGHGTTFRVYFRREVDGRVREETVDEAPYENGGGETILLVEDDPDILSVTEQLLESLGYTVLATRDTEEAVALARENELDISLLLTDVIMPGSTGPDLYGRISDLLPDLPCLYTSGYTANVIATRGELKPGVEFMSKPYSKRELGTRVHEVLAGSARSAATKRGATKRGATT